MEPKSEPERLAAEARTVEAVSPTVYDVARAAGTEVVEMPNGEVRAYYRRQDRSQHENDLAGKRVTEMMRERVRKSCEVSLAREARRDEVTVLDPAGRVRQVPAKREARIAQKAGFRPKVKWGRARRMFVDGQWYRREGKDWIAED